jgi:hypothetical protein
MPDEEGDDTAFQEMMEEKEAFEARFPPEGFAGVAEALGWHPDQETLAAIRTRLLPGFYFFFVSTEGTVPSRDDRVKRLSEVRDAAAALLSLVRRYGGLIDFWSVLDLAAWDEKSRTTVERLIEGADAEIRKLLSSRGRGGRPPKDQFRQLAADLVRAYERLTNSEATKPEWSGGSKFDGKFYEFAVAAERCFRVKVSEREVLKELPATSAALGDGLRKHWPSIREMAREKLKIRKT